MGKRLTVTQYYRVKKSPSESCQTKHHGLTRKLALRLTRYTTGLRQHHRHLHAGPIETTADRAAISRIT